MLEIKDYFLLIVGAFGGACLSYYFPIWKNSFENFFNSKKITARRKFLESGKISSWIVGYYENKDNANDLFDCKIGDFETKIPFLTKSNWQFIKTVHPESES